MIRCADCRFRVESTVFPGLHLCHEGPPSVTRWVETRMDNGATRLDAVSVFPTVSITNPDYGCSRGRRSFWDYLWRMTT